MTHHDTVPKKEVRSSVPSYAERRLVVHDSDGTPLFITPQRLRQLLLDRHRVALKAGHVVGLIVQPVELDPEQEVPHCDVVLLTSEGTGKFRTFSVTETEGRISATHDPERVYSARERNAGFQIDPANNCVSFDTPLYARPDETDAGAAKNWRHAAVCAAVEAYRDEVVPARSFGKRVVDFFLDK